MIDSITLAMLLFTAMVFLKSVSELSAYKSTSPSSCQRPSFAGVELNYSLPIHPPCGEFRTSNGSVITRIPKLIPVPLMKNCHRDGVPPGHRICRIPDCISSPCQNGWCEETMVGYHCHCPEGFTGKDCSIVEQLTESALYSQNDTEPNQTMSSPFVPSSSAWSVTAPSTMWLSLYTTFSSWISTETIPTATIADSKKTTVATSVSTEATTSPAESTTITSKTTTISSTSVSTECPPNVTGNPEESDVTVSVCEGDTADLGCPSGTTINILYANYGRLAGPEVCPYHHQAATTNTDCRYSESQTVVENWCQGKNNCTLRSFHDEPNGFGSDPCQGTYKYLNVTYRCV